MDGNLWIQLVATGGTVITGMLVTIRYSVSQGVKREKAIFAFMQQMQKEQLEYYEKKNGHLERISKEFTKALSRITTAMNKMAKK